MSEAEDRRSARPRRRRRHGRGRAQAARRHHHQRHRSARHASRRCSAGLLSPQGKVLFDFFVVRGEATAFCWMLRGDKAADLVKRLTMYRLRAKADDRRCSATCTRVLAAWGELQRSADDAGIVPLRRPAASTRIAICAMASSAADRCETTGSARRPATTMRKPTTTPTASRSASPKAARTTTFGDAFPHEANFDLLNGVSFERAAMSARRSSRACSIAAPCGSASCASRGAERPVRDAARDR